MTIYDYFTEVETMTLRKLREADTALCREILATPRWRVFKRARLRENRQVAAQAVTFAYHEFSQEARDRLLAAKFS